MSQISVSSRSAWSMHSVLGLLVCLKRLCVCGGVFLLYVFLLNVQNGVLVYKCICYLQLTFMCDKSIWHLLSGELWHTLQVCIDVFRDVTNQKICITFLIHLAACLFLFLVMRTKPRVYRPHPATSSHLSFCSINRISVPRGRGPLCWTSAEWGITTAEPTWRL